MAELLTIRQRINHACKPKYAFPGLTPTMELANKNSAFIRYSKDGIIAGVSAFRDIHPGEEITISCKTLPHNPHLNPQAKPPDISLQEPSEIRKALLHKNWKFTCTCPLCTSPPGQLSADDAKRISLKDLEEQAIAAIHAKELPAALDALTRLADGFSEEGLWPLLQDIYHVLATVSWVLGRRDEAAGYVGRKLDVRDDYARLEVGDRAVEFEEEMRWVGRAR